MTSTLKIATIVDVRSQFIKASAVSVVGKATPQNR
jgi:hypothetical protein